MELTEEFILEGKSFIYIDFSGIKKKDDLAKSFDIIKSIIAKYPENSLYKITNVAGVRFDSEIKEMLVDYVSHNKPYVKSGVIIGVDGIKKITINSIYKITERTNMLFAFSKEQAIDLLLKHE